MRKSRDVRASNGIAYRTNIFGMKHDEANLDIVFFMYKNKSDIVVTLPVPGIFPPRQQGHRRLV